MASLIRTKYVLDRWTQVANYRAYSRCDYKIIAQHVQLKRANWNLSVNIFRCYDEHSCQPSMHAVYYNFSRKLFNKIKKNHLLLPGELTTERRPMHSDQYQDFDSYHMIAH